MPTSLSSSYDFGQDLGEKVELNGFVDFGQERRHDRCFVAEVVDIFLTFHAFFNIAVADHCSRQGPEIVDENVEENNEFIFKTMYNGGKFFDG